MQFQTRHKPIAIPKMGLGDLLKSKLRNSGQLAKNPHDVSNEPRGPDGRWLAGLLGSLIPSAGAGELQPAKSPASPKNQGNQGRHSAAHKPYPNHWDAKVDKYVAEYNAKYGFKPGDKEYLDPNLVKAMIKVESAYDLKAYNSDPMQVNKPKDWDKQEKAKKNIYGLTEGVAPGPDLGIQAGIKWLRYKAYWHDDAGKPYKFKGWPQAVHDYNGEGDPDYVKKVYQLYHGSL